MPLTWLITYENEGKKGNDLSLISPLDWLIKYKEKLPNVVVLSHHERHVGAGEIYKYNELINIENDYPDVFKEPEPEPPCKEDVPCETEDEPINVKVDYEAQKEEEKTIPTDVKTDVDKRKEELRQKRVENARKAREAKKAKEEEKNIQG